MNAPGVDQLLGQSNPEDEVIIVEECQSEDPSSLLACREKDLFSQEEDLSSSQLVAYVNTPIRRILWFLLAPRRFRKLFNLFQLEIGWKKWKTPSGNQ